MNAAFLLLLTGLGTLAGPASLRLAHRADRPLLAPALRLGLLTATSVVGAALALTELSMSALATFTAVVCAVVVWSLGARGAATGRPTGPTDPVRGARRTMTATVLLLAATAWLLVTAQTDAAARGGLLTWWGSMVPGRVPLAAVLACVGLVLLLGTPANAVVAAVLTWAGRRGRPASRVDGAPATQVIGSGLRGGRVIGPLERWLVLALAGAGVHVAIGALVAAKGVIRFPEISQDAQEGSGAKAEEFLIGSLTSWALACAAALVLAAL